MVDVKKIDAYFDGAMSYQAQKRRADPRARALRFAKLVMPSIAAVLVALILVLPNFKKNSVISEYDMTLPKKGELKKLHAEETTFSISEDNGKVSVLTADRMDETKAGSKLIKIIHPKGKIPVNTEEVFVHISSDVGFFNQADNIVILEENVKAVYDEKVTIETKAGEYDFTKGYGHGNKPVYAYGDWGKLWADGFAYDKNKSILYLNGKAKVVHEGSVLTSQKQARYYQTLNKIEAEGNVVLVREDGTLYADKVVIFLSDSKKMDIQKIEATGNVKIETQDAVAQGDSGLYLPKKNEVELLGNVSIEKDGNVVYGDKAITNLDTTVSHMVSTQQKGRVSGVIKGTSIKRKRS
ncbi:MAG: LPS export ABC transporter periplasmic protein LptC [Alphaproteobacteria bacterium]|nr:LPS export ABC transporter periplasmic protein LptC [Alphaproteobacteria bacterium]